MVSQWMLFNEEQKQEHYDRFFESLNRLNLDGVEIILKQWHHSHGILVTLSKFTCPC